MKLSDFQFDLPDELIARFPAEQRRGSRLLCLEGTAGALQHRQFPDLLELVQPGDLMVFNNTRVIPARVFGRKESGGKVEILVERVTGEHTALVHVRASKAPKPGTLIKLAASHQQDAGELDNAAGYNAVVVGRESDLFMLEFPQGVTEVLEIIGHMPLPPYIDRNDQLSDRERYQTVYSEKQGAVAAPTAGLHFDDEFMAALKQRGVEIGFVTLHVGAGTFQPVRVDNIEEHVMHSEYLEVGEALCAQVASTRERGGCVIAVGTTSVRCLETASASGELKPFTGETDIFIYPGYTFKVVDALVTNFHLSESTLIMLVSAFAGTEQVLNAYKVAVAERYRFFSYGDAMFITRADHPTKSKES